MKVTVNNAQENTRLITVTVSSGMLKFQYSAGIFERHYDEKPNALRRFISFFKSEDPVVSKTISFLKKLEEKYQCFFKKDQQAEFSDCLVREVVALESMEVAVFEGKIQSLRNKLDEAITEKQRVFRDNPEKIRTREEMLEDLQDSLEDYYSYENAMAAEEAEDPNPYDSDYRRVTSIGNQIRELENEMSKASSNVENINSRMYTLQNIIPELKEIDTKLSVTAEKPVFSVS